MNETIERAVAIAIESYVHAPRTLTILEVVRQVTAVFPDQDHTKVAHVLSPDRQRDSVRRAEFYQSSNLWNQGGRRTSRSSSGREPIKPLAYPIGVVVHYLPIELVHFGIKRRRSFETRLALASSVDFDLSR
jgi:hypothetical protein